VTKTGALRRDCLLRTFLPLVEAAKPPKPSKDSGSSLRPSDSRGYPCQAATAASLSPELVRRIRCPSTFEVLARFPALS
jgi:hypothetical protein